MSDQNLSNAFEDCIQRLAKGQSVEDCLRLYPQYAPDLRLMLETGLFVRRIQPHNPEIALASERVRLRVEAYQKQRRTYGLGWSRLATAAALFLAMLLGAGATAAGFHLANNLDSPTSTHTPTPTATSTPTASTTVTATPTPSASVTPRHTYAPTRAVQPTEFQPPIIPTGQPTIVIPPTEDHDDDNDNSGGSDNSGPGSGDDDDNSGSGSDNSGSDDNNSGSGHSGSGDD